MTDERMTEQELEDKILSVVPEYPLSISKTEAWRDVGGDKKRCLDKIYEMIQTSQIIARPAGKNRVVLISKTDLSRRKEFEFGLKIQENLLKECREGFRKLKSGMFNDAGIVVHCEPPLPMKGKKFGIQEGMRFNRKKGVVFYKGTTHKIVEEIQIWKIKPSRKRIIEHGLAVMAIYHNALLLFIARANLQRSLGIITKSESEFRIAKCEMVIDKHFKRLLIENPKDADGLRQYISWMTFEIERFRI